MKKQLTVIIALIMVLTLSACTNPVNNIQDTGTKDGSTNAHANIVSTVSAPDTNQTNADPGKDNTVDTPVPDNNGNGPQGIDESWKKIYADFLENDMDEIIGEYAQEESDGWTAGFIYVNDDTVPEVVLSSGYEAGGNTVLTIVDGEVKYLRTFRLGLYYDEFGNILANSDGHMGYYYDYVYTITDRGFEMIHRGEYYELFDDEDGYTNEFEYYLDDEEVSAEEYFDDIESYLPSIERICWTSGSTLKSVMDYLKGEDYVDYKDAYRSVTEEMLGAEGAYFALIESYSFSPYLLLYYNNRAFIYYYQDGVAFRGEDFYLSETSEIFFYPENNTVCSVSKSAYAMGVYYYIYTSNMGSNNFTYVSRYGECDENGDIIKDEDGMYIFNYVINSESVSEMEYAEYINQRDSEYYVTIKSPGENDSEDYEYYTPEDMYDLLGK